MGVARLSLLVTKQALLSLLTTAEGECTAVILIPFLSQQGGSTLLILGEVNALWEKMMLVSAQMQGREP